MTTPSGFGETAVRSWPARDYPIPPEDDHLMTEIRPGRYRHYKGNEYTVLGVARHSETLEEFVVYRQEYGERGLWVRPAAMFAETVEIEGRIVPRFEFLGRE
jgi:hypothetical protein